MKDDAEPTHKQDIFDGAMFDVEHALDMYATTFFTLPAEYIYRTEMIAQHKSIIETCHIYMIGLLPQIEMLTVQEKEQHLIMTLLLQGQKRDLKWPIPAGFALKQEEDLYFLQNRSGERIWPSDSAIQQCLKASDAFNFDVKYIGQAYGADGSRNAIDRLLKHETLQKISLLGIPEGMSLSLLLLAIQPNNRTLTVFNPFAQEKDEKGERQKAGLDKLFGTSENERVALYEASLIRYFAPVFNKKLKDSFPSTNMEILKNCYDKDFAAVIAEICIDELPFKLFSDVVKPANYHIATHDLHDNEARKIFFSGK